ncbi:MAG: transporter substrate-binding domain-containing protein [Prevotella sp.]|nr:transporter substrate-binding domain-containing protein [Candidatus Prevotella equi]
MSNAKLHIIIALFMALYSFAPLRAQEEGIMNLFTKISDNTEKSEGKSDLRSSLYRRSQPLGIRYTKKHPLIIVADWSFKPYTFVNDRGEADGFQIEIFRSIFDKIHVPYEIRMMDWRKAKKEVENGHAHLMMAIASPGVSHKVHYGKMVVGEYQLAVMHKKSTQHIRSLLLLSDSDSIYSKRLDYGDQYIRDNFVHDVMPFYMENCDPQVAFTKIINDEIKYYIWGRSALKNMARRYNYEESLEIDPVDIPAGQFRFASTDSVLIYELDMQLQRLKEMGDYNDIVNRWLIDNPVERQGRSMVEIIAIVALVLIFVTIAFITIILQRSTMAANLKEEFLSISQMAISLTNSKVVAISPRKMWVYNVSGDLLPEEGISYLEFESLVHPEDIKIVYDSRNQVDNGKNDMPTITFRIKRHGDDTNNYRMMNVSAHVKTNRRGKPTYIYLVLVDETERMEEQKLLDKTLREFASITDIPEVGMIYYDKNGKLINCNRAIVRIFDKGGTGRAENFVHKTTMQEMPVIFNGILMERDMNMWFCTPLEIPELNLRTNIEVRIQSVYDDRKNHCGYAISIVDLEDQITLKRDLSEIMTRLDVLKKQLSRYQGELRFILRNNRMNTFRWRVGLDYVEISRDLLSFDMKLTLEKYFDSIIDDRKADYEWLLASPEKYFSKPINVTRQFRIDVKGNAALRWYSINVIPEYDENNRFIGAFGMACDMTDFVNSQELLRKETAKAEDSGRQKALFLANMTHELRTPLNVINGFAEVMKFFSTPEEKEEYIGIMTHNCTMLISLIDNILQLSMMDTDGIKIHKRTVDFAAAFHKEVSKFGEYITKPEVQYIIDSPMKSLILDIDMGRVMQIVDAFVNNASKFTEKGFVRVGYRYVHGVLTIYCRDTGRGIPKEEQQHVFERFVKLDDFVPGTGLGLSVCKMIAENMNATIDIYSREGEGTTMSVNIKNQRHMQ